MSERKIVEASIPDVEELLERVREMKPRLRERAPLCEEMRHVHPDTVAEFEAAGFYRILQPIEYGGYALAPDKFFRVVREVAEACSASAWCLSIVGVHNWEFSRFPKQAAKDVWGEDSATRISSSYAPFGKFTKVDGGVRVSGRWPWSSGSTESSWVILGGNATAYSGGEPPGACAVLIPRVDYKIEDTWQVAGLKGTGSNDIVVDDVFVPDHRVHAIQMEDKWKVGDSPFRGQTYEYPFFITFGYCLASSVLGMGKSMMNEFIEWNQERQNAYGIGVGYKDSALVQHRVAKAWALLDGAELKFDRDWAAMRELVERGKPIPLALRTQCKWSLVWIAYASEEACSLLFKAAGGTAIYSKNPMQRIFRDVMAATNHLYLQFDRGSSNFGQFLLSGESPDPQI